jgi:flavin-binding protein dodecin
MVIIEVAEVLGVSRQGSDDAIREALAEARTTIEDIRALEVISVGLSGEDLQEWRAHVRVAFRVKPSGGG